jgi:hypothetical protein
MMERTAAAAAHIVELVPGRMMERNAVVVVA